MPTAVQSNQVTVPAGSSVAESEAERNTALLRRFIEEGFNKGNLAVVDVGGGQGTLLAAILAKHPTTTGILFDQPHGSRTPSRSSGRQGS